MWTYRPSTLAEELSDSAMGSGFSTRPTQVEITALQACLRHRLAAPRLRRFSMCLAALLPERHQFIDGGVRAELTIIDAFEAEKLAHLLQARKESEADALFQFETRPILALE